MEKHLLILYCCKSPPTTKGIDMQIQYINGMLGIPELHIQHIWFIYDDELHLEASPLSVKQCCPICKTDQDVIRKGSNGLRRVRHLPVFEKNIYLNVHSIRMHCTSCDAGFVWAYEFVGAK